MILFKKKFNINVSDAETHFVLLKRSESIKEKCELITISSGNKKIENATNLVTKTIKSMKKPPYLKNYNSCKFCPFKNTKHCP